MLTFIPFQKEHLPLLRSWLNASHIKPYWHESDDDQKLADKFLVQLPERNVSPFIIQWDRNIIGYIQYYDAKRVGGGWWPNEPQGTFGIDLMLGEINFVGKGLAPSIIKEFVQFLVNKEPTAKEVIIDPSPENQIAIRAFEKSGFTKEAEINTPGGRALLMRMRL